MLKVAFVMSSVRVRRRRRRRRSCRSWSCILFRARQTATTCHANHAQMKLQGASDELQRLAYNFTASIGGCRCRLLVLNAFMGGCHCGLLLLNAFVACCRCGLLVLNTFRGGCRCRLLVLNAFMDVCRAGRRWQTSQKTFAKHIITIGRRWWQTLILRERGI